jgi:hypothetical protein
MNKADEADKANKANELCFSELILHSALRIYKYPRNLLISSRGHQKPVVVSALSLRLPTWSSSGHALPLSKLELDARTSQIAVQARMGWVSRQPSAGRRKKKCHRNLIITII